MKTFVFTATLLFVLSSCALKQETQPTSHEYSHLDNERFIHTSYDKLDKDSQKLLDAAEQIMKNSYSPYTKFMVGAALQTKEGKIYTGTNVEDATTHTGTCAERAAIFHLVAAKQKKALTKVAIIGKGHDFETKEVVAPCGVCRQMLYEFSQLSGVDVEVIMSNSTKDKVVLAKISDLLPMAFGPKDLGFDISQI